MIPYLIWSVALFSLNHNVEYYNEYLLYPQKSLWFLWALFCIVILFNAVESIAYKLKLRHEVAMGLCWIALVGVMFVMPDAKLLGVEYVAYYFFFYLTGFYLHKNSDVLVVKNWLLIAVVGLAWFALGSIYSTQGLPRQLTFIPLIPSSALYYIYRICTALLAILFLFSLAMKLFTDCCGVTAWIVRFGKVSLGIYAVHMVIRFRLVDGLVAVVPGLSYWPLMLLTFAILLPAAYLLVWLIGKNKWSAEFLLGKLRQ